MFLDRLATMSSGPSSWQKGMDVLAETLNHLVGISGLLELLGPGDAEIEQRFLAAAARHNGRIGVRIDY
jgi:starch synthase